MYIYVDVMPFIHVNFVWKTRGNPEDELIKRKKKRKKKHADGGARKCFRKF